MNDNATPIATLFERAEDYSKTSLELYKLNTIDKTADVVSSLVSNFAIFMTVALSLLILNIGVSLWIGNYYDELYYGFFIVGGFYVFIGIILCVFRQKWMKIPISNTIIKKMLKQKNS